MTPNCTPAQLSLVKVELRRAHPPFSIEPQGIMGRVRGCQASGFDWALFSLFLVIVLEPSLLYKQLTGGFCSKNPDSNWLSKQLVGGGPTQGPGLSSFELYFKHL